MGGVRYGLAMTNDADAVRDSALSLLDEPRTWVEPKGYTDSLALCAIDSVYSLRARYTSVVRVLDRYRAARRAQGADPASDSGPDLTAFIDEVGGPAAFASDVVHNQTKAPGTNILKAATLHEAVRALAAAGCTTTVELRDAGIDTLDRASTAWRGTKGLGQVSWDYFLMNAGIDGVKADTMVRRFVTLALEADATVGIDRARAAVAGAAETFGVTSRTLDHAIWRYQSSVRG